MKMYHCRKCGIVLNDDNWCTSRKERGAYICNKCRNEQYQLWQKANPDKAKASHTRSREKRGSRPFNENKECPMYLGGHVAERVLFRVFKDVEVMPYGNHGFDFICNKGMKIDVKSSCLNAGGHWVFNINHNIVADYFLCIAFDNRKNLNPLYIWLLPGDKMNHYTTTAGISPSTVHRWNEYKLDISKVATCCDILKTENNQWQRLKSNSAYKTSSTRCHSIHE